MITEIETMRKGDKSGRAKLPIDTKSPKHPVLESGFDVVLVTLSELLPPEAFSPENL